MKVLVTCPPMIGIKDQLIEEFERLGLLPHFAEVVQTLSADELIELAPEFDGWIIGDDPATASVFEAAHAGNLKAAVKWGVGVDNVDFAACSRLGLPISNTPGMFGKEVADIAIGYLIGLARHTFQIDRAVRDGNWIKPRGQSLAGKRIGLVGCGDIGFQVLRRLAVLDCQTLVYDPYVSESIEMADFNAARADWPEGAQECDFLILTCALTPETHHLLDADFFARCKSGAGIVNVSRGGLIDEASLVAALTAGHINAALDVFEQEPVADERILSAENCILGSHNASNTAEAVMRTSLIALEQLAADLNA